MPECSSARKAACQTAALLFIAAMISLQGCSYQHPVIFQPQNPPLFFDDGDPASLQTALSHQYRFISSLEKDTTVNIGGMPYTAAWLAESLAAFQEIIDLEPTPLELDRIIHENFTIYQAGGRHKSGAEMLVTGYYEPLVSGSLTHSPPFIHPLHSTPSDLVERTTASGKKVIGRIDDGGRFQPYWRRKEIEGTDLLRDYELVYLKDRFEAFLFHVQGSGRIRLPDGSVRSLQYRTNNGHSYSSIGKLLVDEKKMLLEEADTNAIRAYLRRNPAEVSRILNHNRRFIFFGWGGDEGPKGSIGVPLTAERSIAIDKEVLPMGTVAFLVTRRPVLDENGEISHWVPLHRFVVPQDSGAAIKGPGRVDLFWGGGPLAQAAAGAMKEQGYLYFLIKNTFEAAND